MNFRAGDRVRLIPFGLVGTVTGLLTGRCEIALGSARAVCRAADLEPAGAESAPGAPAPELTVHFMPAAAELDIHAMNRDEAAAKVEQFLNRAWLGRQGMVRIIHGKGAGVLQGFLKAYLAGHPLVRQFRYGAYGDGDTGVTMVILESGPDPGRVSDREER